MDCNKRMWITRVLRAGLRWTGASVATSLLLVASPVQAQEDLVAKGLGYSPRQQGITYDLVPAKDAAKCTGKYETRNGFDGLVIYSPEGQPLRRFADSNGDRNVDQWCYFKDGIEVYRDIDSDFNGVADEYRWLGTAGTRWALDKNEDGKIDSWKAISAEEVTMEVVEAIKTRDSDRFMRLLLNDSDLSSLGLGEDKGDQLTTRLAGARKGFNEFLKNQKLIKNNTRWVNFAADKPGVVPAGTEGSTEDIVAYENAIAIVENDNASQQLMIGTLVQLGNAWRLADLPKVIGEGTTLSDNGFFFPAAASNRMASAGGGTDSMNPAIQSLLNDLEQIDSKLSETDSKAAKERLHESRFEILQKLVNASRGTEDMGLWIRQFADTVSTAVQSGEYTDGVSRLKKLEAFVSSLPKGKEQVPYVAYRILSTDYSMKTSDPNADFAKLQRDHLQNLESFVEIYPDSTDSAEAMIQIGLINELAGDEKGALKWYRMASTKFPETPQGEKAAGATARLNLEGQKIALVGKTLEGKSFDSKANNRGPTVVHYWASWCEPCKQDMMELRKLQAKYAKKNLQIVGVNLDTNADEAIKFLNNNTGKFPWDHIHEQGGFESSLAVKLGVLSVPVTILIDSQGIVVKRTSHFSSDMNDALEELLDAQQPALAQAPKQVQPPPPKPMTKPTSAPNATNGGAKQGTIPVQKNTRPPSK